MYRLPTDRKWYEDLALLEGDDEVAAGHIETILDTIPDDREPQIAEADEGAAPRWLPKARQPCDRAVRERPETEAWGETGCKEE
jgi:hypothetical protein